jgi:hypothetical protein
MPLLNKTSERRTRGKLNNVQRVCQTMCTKTWEMMLLMDASFYAMTKKLYARNKSCPKIGCVFSAVEILIIGSQTNETVQSEFQIQRLI